MVLIDQTRPQLLLLHGACPKTARLNEKGGFPRARASTNSCNSQVPRDQRPSHSRQRVFGPRIAPTQAPAPARRKTPISELSELRELRPQPLAASAARAARARANTHTKTHHHLRDTLIEDANNT
jgi:hypothetical protein